ncbi:MAG: type II toxin-antitoxin system death-on-curing family toxin [Syntrophomonadaceae bacterium]|jgi:death-on-curing protein|nr:type II toxin-antitoxin system death-on-curing family toxin [Syntrophomonadaceae bacterium]
MKRPSLEQVKKMHDMLIIQTGGLSGIRDNGSLESAISSPFQSFAGEDIYPTIAEKAARLGFGIIKNHPFVDGNKRIGILVMLVFLKLNEIYLSYSDDELIQIGLGLASGAASFDDLVKWILQRK